MDPLKNEPGWAESPRSEAPLKRPQELQVKLESHCRCSVWTSLKHSQHGEQNVFEVGPWVQYSKHSTTPSHSHAETSRSHRKLPTGSASWRTRVQSLNSEACNAPFILGISSQMGRHEISIGTFSQLPSTSHCIHTALSSHLQTLAHELIRTHPLRNYWLASPTLVALFLIH